MCLPTYLAGLYVGSTELELRGKKARKGYSDHITFR